MHQAARSHHDGRAWLAPLLAGLLASCGPTAEDFPATTAGESTETSPSGTSDARVRCTAPPGVSGRPGTNEEVVALLNALPKPTTVACFLDSLQRPLQAFATDSVFSAQPALSARSPRVFLALDRLWVSVVIDGDSSSLIELGYRPPGDDLRSVKGELALPLTEPVATSAPYDRVRYQEGTVCGLCHLGEQAAAAYGQSAYLSAAFRPRPESRVALDGLAAELATCDAKVEPQRCEMLSALFGGGVVTELPFPEEMRTFF